MKKLFTSTIVVILFCVVALAQPPQSFKYQAVLRNATGQVLANQEVVISVSILQGSVLGTEVFAESHELTTNGFGLANLNIGEMEPVMFSSIDWSMGPYFVKIMVDGVEMGTSQLLSVPYALYAGSVENDAVDDADADPENEIQDISLEGHELSITEGSTVTLPDEVDDADADPANELQDISLAGQELSITEGSTVTLPDEVDDADADPLNELQELALEGDQLSISDGNTVILPDADPTNELQDITLVGQELSISDGNTVTLPDKVDDADADPTNELQEWGPLPGIPDDIADGDDVDDADADPTNELQDWETLPGIPDNVQDGDNQLLAWLVNKNHEIKVGIEDGNSLDMPFVINGHQWYEWADNINYVPKWAPFGSIIRGIIYDDGTNIGIGTNTPDYKLQVDGDIVPETDGSRNLGAPLLGWDNLYLSSNINYKDNLIFKQSIGTEDVHMAIDYTTGDIDINNKLNVDGDVTFTSGTSSTTPTSGTLVVTGGVGVSEDVNIGGDLDVDGATDLDQTDIITDDGAFIVSGNNGVDIDVDAASRFVTSTGAITVDAEASTVTVDGHTGVTVVSATGGIDIDGAGGSDVTIEQTTFVDDDILPDAADGGNLGSPTNRWAALYMASVIDYASALDIQYNNGAITAGTFQTNGNLDLNYNLNVTGNGTFKSSLFIENSGNTILHAGAGIFSEGYLKTRNPAGTKNIVTVGSTDSGNKGAVSVGEDDNVSDWRASMVYLDAATTGGIPLDDNWLVGTGDLVNAEGAFFLYDDVLTGTDETRIAVVDGSLAAPVFTVDSEGDVATDGNLIIDGNTTLGNAAADRITFTGEVLGQYPLYFQGATDNAFRTRFEITDPTADRTIVFPDGSGTMPLLSDVVLRDGSQALTANWDAGAFTITADGLNSDVIDAENAGALTLGATTATSVEISQSGATTTVKGNLTVDENTNLATVQSGTWNGTAIGETYGGTGQTTYTTGDILYSSAANTLSKLADDATGNALISGGVGVAPNWGKIGLTTHVSGTLPVANGGTGITSLGAGVATFLGTPSSANLASAITDETGSGAAVFATSPTLTTPKVGPNGTTITNIIKVTFNKDIGFVGSGTFGTETFLVPGATLTSSAILSPAGDLGNLIITQTWVSAAGIVSIKLYNPTGSTVDPGPMDFYITVIE